MFTTHADLGLAIDIDLSRRAAKHHELFTAAAERTRAARQLSAQQRAERWSAARRTPGYRVALARTLVGLAHRLDPA